MEGADILHVPTRLPLQVRALIVARTVNRLGALSLPFLSLELTHELGASLTTVGLLLAAFGVASMASRLLGGWLADRWGRRRTMVAGLVACALAQLAIAAADSLLTAGLSVIALGLAFEIYEAPSQALIADGVDPQARASAFGLLGASLSVAALLAGLVATVVAPLSIRLLFVFDATSCLAAALLVKGLLAHDRPIDRARRRVRSGESPWRSPLLRFLFTTNVVFAAGYLQVAVSLPLTLQHRGIAASGYGVILVTTSAVSLLALPILRSRRLADRSVRISHAPPIIGGSLLLALGFVGYGVAHTLVGFLGAAVIVGVGEVLLAGHVLALVSAVGPPHRRAQFLAAFGLSWGVAATLGPLPGTLLLEHGGDLTLWSAVAGCFVGVAGSYARMARRSGPTVASLRLGSESSDGSRGRPAAKWTSGLPQ